MSFLKCYLLPALQSAERMLTQIGSQIIKTILKEKLTKVNQQISKKISLIYPNLFLNLDDFQIDDPYITISRKAAF